MIPFEPEPFSGAGGSPQNANKKKPIGGIPACRFCGLKKKEFTKGDNLDLHYV